MKYKWVSVGSQETRINKSCFLGPYVLEHVEDHWQDETPIMSNRVFLWDPVCHEYLIHKVNLESTPYVDNESYKILEDWYACNVLVDKYFAGEKDE